MKLKNYAAALAILAEKYPNADVIHSSDDEGNFFKRVVYEPTEGNFNCGEFNSEAEGKKVNAVCVN